jgi:hypothetical protein
MTPTKSIDKTNALKDAIPEPTIWAFVHAAVLASLIVDSLVLVVFSFMALSDHRGVFGTTGWTSPNRTIPDGSSIPSGC